MVKFVKMRKNLSILVYDLVFFSQRTHSDKRGWNIWPGGGELVEDKADYRATHWDLPDGGG